MKKLFTSTLLVLSALTIQAKDYTGSLNIVVPDMMMNIDQDASVSVTQQNDGNYELTIEKFNFEGLPVGTINVKDVKATVSDNGLTALQFKGNTVILDDGLNGLLVGQTVELDLNGVLSNTGFRANIEIVADMDGTLLPVSVKFTPDGKAAQIPNSDFENFHTATYNNYSSTEADHWHSFTSAKTTSSLYNAVRIGKQSEESTEVREGTNGKKCLKITSDVIVGKAANGTVTTGRLQAGSMSATNTANHAFLDLSNTEKDDLGDPFYTTLTTIPDAIEFWCRFKQGQDNLSNKYASMRAVITDGTYYQDPEDKTYNNVVAVAVNKTIEGTDVWQKVTTNFDYATYASNKVEPKAILVTISTNSQPGVASTDKNSHDYIYIDDLSLIYNANIESLSVKGTEVKDEDGDRVYTTSASGNISLDDIVVTSDGKGAYITKSLESTDNGVKVNIEVLSNDLKIANSYVLYINGATTGIKAPQTVTLPNGVNAIYNLAGQQVGSMTPGQVYIVKTTDGQTKKVIKK